MYEKVILRSLDRLSGTPQKGSLKQNELLDGIYKLIEFSTINSIYNVNNYNNKIYFDESSSSKVATLTNGSYDLSSIVTEIQTQMNSAGGNTYSLSLSSTTNKISFVSTGDFAFTFGSNTNNSARFLLGMNEEDVSPEAESDVSDFTIDISPIKYIFCSFDRINSPNIISNTSLNATFLIRDNNSSFGSILNYKNDDNSYKQIVELKTIKNIKYEFFDDEFNPLNNFNEWILILERIK